ncbi:KGGVGR-motif variant AAA ATPase [Nocardia takedensis]
MLEALNDYADLPDPPKRLFTWVDVEEHFALIAARRQWPAWLLSADCFWDGIEVVVRPDVTDAEIGGWLDRAFGPGSVMGFGAPTQIRLDDPRTRNPVGLDIRLVRSDDENVVATRRVPALRDSVLTAESARPLERPDRDELPGETQFVAFHSFKGGVGRTVHGVAMADDLARRGGRVLLVDADLEAPGVTWMYREQGGKFDFCYEDLLALLHSSQDGGWEDAIAIGSPFLSNQQVGRYVDGGRVTVLPVSRRVLLGPPRIEPADLLTAGRPRYFLTEALAALAAEIDASTVIVDLRAGASELSAPILLDPRVQRIFVTSLSDQSLIGTKMLVEQLVSRAPTIQGIDPASAVVITQFRPDTHDEQLRTVCQDFGEILASSLQLPAGSDEAELDETVDTTVLSHPVLSPFSESLLALPSSWDAVTRLLRQINLAQTMNSVLNEPVSADRELVGGTAVSGPTQSEARRRLAEGAGALIYAEGAAMNSASGFLVTDALEKLLTNHRTEPPVVLVVGAKGAGKTFLFAKACVARTWQSFAQASGIADVALDAPIIPVLESDSLQPGEVSTQELRDSFAAAHYLGDGTAATKQSIKDLLQDHLQRGETSAAVWRQIWLRCLALSAGLDPLIEPEVALTEMGKGWSAVFVIDGLEDLLQAITEDAKSIALRVLLVDVVDWLRTLRGRPIGLIVFVRRDLVSRAVQQNAGQLLDRYKQYSLRWDKTEALRLALWAAHYVDALPPQADSAADMTEDELVAALVPLWGWKMGTERSKQARSHLWVPAALGDYNGQVQARDVVMFLHQAAAESLAISEWDDRVLVPTAMRKALLECSRSKIREIQEENRELGDLLEKMREASRGGQVIAPFDYEVLGLSLQEVTTLVESGVLRRDKRNNRYHVAEIYRHYLGIRSRRARVVWR